MIPIAAAVFGLGLIGFGLSRSFWLSMFMVLIAGMGMLQGMAVSNTVIQTIVSEDKRGRVMSYYTLAFLGMAPFGSLLAGTMAHKIGAPWTVAVNGFTFCWPRHWFATGCQPCGARSGSSTRSWAFCRGGRDFAVSGAPFPG